MTDIKDTGQDVALEALDALSEVTRSGAKELQAINDDLATIRRRRSSGWTWRRIMASREGPDALSAASAIAAGLGRACGEFRRCLAQALRREGMRTAAMGDLLGVSRQRVSALLHPKNAD